MQVQTAGRRYDDDGAVHRFYADALDAVRRVPGVAAAGLTSQLPLSGDLDEYGVHFEPVAALAAEPDANRSGLRYAVTPGYFETMGIPLRRGRLLDGRDAGDAPPVAILGESFARRKFPGADPVGRRLRVGPDDGPWSTIVGVVGDVRQTSLAAAVPDAVYIPTAQWRFPDRALWLVVRAAPGGGDPAALAPAVRAAVWSVDRDQPVVRVATMERLLAASAAERRFVLVLFEAFAGVALALATIGLYGVLAGSVAERTREIGVRSALGASRGAIVALVVRQGATLVAAGVTVGLAGAAAASRGLTSLLFGVSRLDPATYLAVVALLAAASLLACWIPARRASRVEPVVALRGE
jgi:putative ABC transport system permease protein